MKKRAGIGLGYLFWAAAAEFIVVVLTVLFMGYARGGEIWVPDATVNFQGRLGGAFATGIFAYMFTGYPLVQAVTTWILWGRVSPIIFSISRSLFAVLYMLTAAFFIGGESVFVMLDTWAATLLWFGGVLLVSVWMARRGAVSHS